VPPTTIPATPSSLICLACFGVWNFPSAKMLAVTTYIYSPVGSAADLVLQTAIKEFLNGGSLAGKVA